MKKRSTHTFLSLVSFFNLVKVFGETGCSKCMTSEFEPNLGDLEGTLRETCGGKMWGLA